MTTISKNPRRIYPYDAERRTAEISRRAAQIDEHAERPRRRRVRMPEPTTAILPSFDHTLAENLITLLAYDDKDGKTVADSINTALFEGDFRLIAERCVDYWREYKKPPVDHTADLVADITEDANNRRSGSVKRILTQMAQLRESMNPNYVMNQLRMFQKMQRMKSAVLESADKINNQAHLAIGEIEDIWSKILSTDTSSGVLTLRKLSTFKREKASWLWDPFIPKSGITKILGDGDAGKSTFMRDIAARITTGRAMPNYKDFEQEVIELGSVIWLAKEESAGEIRSYLEAAGGDSDKVLVPGYEGEWWDVLHTIDQKSTTRLEQLLQEAGDVRLMVIDPVTEYAGDKNINSESEVRQQLTRLQQVAHRNHFAILMAIHPNKNSEQRTSERSMAAGAYRNVPRSGVIITKELDGTRHVVLEKGNNSGEPIGSAAEFHIRSVRAGIKIKWHDEFEQQDINAVFAKKSKTKQSKADDMLREMLKDGPRLQTDIMQRAIKLGISEETLRRAKRSAGVKTSKGAGGKFHWELEA